MAITTAARAEAIEPRPGYELDCGYYTCGFQAMGTTCRIMFAMDARAKADRLASEIQEWVADFERRYSRFKPDSLISEINRNAGEVPVKTDPELESLFSLCDWFHWQSRGIFDPTALPLELLWDYHEPVSTLPAASAIERARELSGWKKVARDQGRVFLPRKGMGLDIGGIGKEYAVDRVLAKFVAAGCPSALVDFGHDIRAHGSPPEGGSWRIGLERPERDGGCSLGVALRDRAVATSGDYQRFFEVDGIRYGHVLDPRTGWPARSGCHSVSVVASTCTEAGILATTALVLGMEKGLEYLDGCYGVEGCMIGDKGIARTRGFGHYEI